MSEALRRLFEGFLQEFATPFVLGGPARVGAPLGRRELEYFATNPGADALASAALLEQREAIAREVVVRPPAIRPLENDPPALHLLVAAHNVLALSHPAFRQGLMRRRTWRRAHAFTRGLVNALPLPSTAGEAVLAHTLLHNLPRVRRTDHVVRTWAGARTFHGQAPPRRALWFSRLRRVHVEASKSVWLEEAQGAAPHLELLSALLTRSPLTHLAHPAAKLVLTDASALFGLSPLAAWACDTVHELVERRRAELPAIGDAFRSALAAGGCSPAALRAFGTILVRALLVRAWRGNALSLAALGEGASGVLGAAALLVEAERDGAAGAPALDVERLARDADPRTAASGQALLALAGPTSLAALVADVDAVRRALRARLAA